MLALSEILGLYDLRHTALGLGRRVAGPILLIRTIVWRPKVQSAPPPSEAPVREPDLPTFPMGRRTQAP